MALYFGQCMLYGLQGLGALAGDFGQSVLRKESLRVFTNEGMSCNNTIESGVGQVNSTEIVCSDSGAAWCLGWNVWCLAIWEGRAPCSRPSSCVEIDANIGGCGSKKRVERCDAMRHQYASIVMKVGCNTTAARLNHDFYSNAATSSADP